MFVCRPQPSQKKHVPNLFFNGRPICFFLTCFYFCQPSRQTFWRGRDWQASPYKKSPAGASGRAPFWDTHFTKNAYKTCSKLHFGGQNGSPKGRPRLAGFFFLACFFSGGQLAIFSEEPIWGHLFFLWLARFVFSDLFFFCQPSRQTFWPRTGRQTNNRIRVP